MKRAAVALIERVSDERVLCVWNGRYNGWTLPGGLVEKGETVDEGLVRELREETSLEAVEWVSIFAGPPLNDSLVSKTELQREQEKDRAGHVHVFLITRVTGIAREVEIGRPVTWFTREEFLKWSPFALFYERLFREILR